MELGIDGDALQVHREGPEEVAVVAGAMGTDDQRQNERGNDQVQRRVLLREEEALTERVLPCEQGETATWCELCVYFRGTITR